MISVASWYSSKAKRPLIGLIIAIVVVQILYLISVLRVNQRRHEDLLDNLIRFTSVALMQKNRVMLESLVYTVSENPDFKKFVLCQGKQPLVSFPAVFGRCAEETSNLFVIEDVKVVPGFEEYKIFTAARRYKVPQGYVWVVALTGLLSIISIGVVLVVSRRFEREILAPIRSDFEGAESDAIEEFASLKRRRAQIIELEKEKVFSDLAKQVAHDIRSPLSALQLFVQSRKGQSASGADFLSTVTERVSRIADNLLDQGRKITQSHQSTIFALEEESQRIMQEKILRFPAMKIKFERGTAGSSHLFVQVHLIEWGRIVSNLIENAIEASPARDSEISLNSRVGDDCFHFFCADQGVGISNEILHKLKINGGTFGKTNGNGMGLGHLRKVIEQSGGSWDISSTLGKGTRVTVEIPLASANGLEKP